MVKLETKLKIKEAKNGKDIAQAMIDHFRSQDYFKKSEKKLAILDPLAIFDGKLPL